MATTSAPAPCASEFDYAGWKDWGVWKRNLLLLTQQQRQRSSPCDSVFDDESEDEVEEITTTASVVSPISAGVGGTSSWRDATPLQPVKDCWNRCDYPSECRWGKQFGVDTPLQPTFPTLNRVPSTPNPNNTPADDSTDLVDVDMNDIPTSPATVLPQTKTHFSDILTAEQQQVVAETIDGVEVEESLSHPSHTPIPALADLAGLVTRAQRRHLRSEIPASPLAEVSQESRRVTRGSSRESLRRAVEGGIGVIAGFVGVWRSYSAPPVGRRKEDEEEDGDVGMVDVDLDDKGSGNGRGRSRRKSLG